MKILAFFMGVPGWMEICLLGAVGLLIFGKRLPETARSIGSSVIEFKKGLSGIKEEIENPEPPKLEAKPDVEKKE